MLDQLSSHDRLQLVRFVCSLAWADLEVRDEERAYIYDLIRRLDLDETESQQVETWLNHPPSPDDLDPGEVSLQHREIFLQHMLEVAKADGELAVEEQEAYELLSQLIR